MLILIYNTMYGEAPDLGRAAPTADRPAQFQGFEFTLDRQRMHEADVVVFHIPDLRRAFMPWKRRGQIWVAWSLECPVHYKRLRSAWFMSRFNLTMSYRQEADVFAAYIPEALIGDTVPPPLTLPGEMNRREHLVCSFVSGSVDRSGRNHYLDELARRLDLHRYGRLGNREIANDQGGVSKRALASTYKFTIAFENAIAKDYVTEKFYDPLLAGSVPVYLGAPNVHEYAPAEHCYIDTADFSGPAELADYLLELDRDDAAYSRYLNWRDRPRLPAFRALCERNAGTVFERLCLALEERNSGRRKRS